MNTFYLLISIFYTFYRIHCKTYVLSQEICRQSLNISDISIGHNVDSSINQEIVVISNYSLMYWPDSTSADLWRNDTLPWNWSSSQSAIVTFKRNFVQELSECQQNISDFFVIKYNPNSKAHEYDIYDPRSSTKWRYSGQSSSPRLLSDHYVFKNKRFSGLTSGLALSEHLILFEGSRYHIIELNKSDCNVETNLSSTVHYLGNNSLPYEPISSFYWNQELNFVIRSDESYSINHMAVDLDKIQNVSIDQSQQTNDPIFGYLFECHNTSVTSTSNNQSDTTDDQIDQTTISTINVNETNSEAIGTVESLNTRITNSPEITESTDSNVNQTLSPTTSDFMATLMIILVVSLIVSIIVCICCCWVSNPSQPSPTNDEKAISNKKTEQKQILSVKPMLKTDNNVKKKTDIPDKESKKDIVIAIEKPKSQPKTQSQPPKVVIPSNESIISSHLPSSVIGEQSDVESEDKSVSSPELQNTIQSSTTTEGKPISEENKLSEEIAPDEGKPSNPFEGFPDS